MAVSTLENAKKFMRRRKFDLALKCLESSDGTYEFVPEYYIMLGLANLYLDVTGDAMKYFTKARELTLRNTTLLLGQAVIFLMRGATDRAIDYYLEVLELDPNNQTAKEALDFIKVKGDYTTIVKWVDSGDIKRFYPPLGHNPDVIRNCLLVGAAVGIIASFFIVAKPLSKIHLPKKPFEVQDFSLTTDELDNPVDSQLDKHAVEFVMKPKDVTSSFESAKKYFGEGRDNLAQVELNRILSSNAVISIKQKAAEMMSLLNEPTFDSLKARDNFEYEDVFSNPSLFVDCYVKWTGKVENMRTDQDGSVRCKLLVYNVQEKNKTDMFKGTVDVVFQKGLPQSFNSSRMAVFLARIALKEGSVYLDGKAVYQELKK